MAKAHPSARPTFRLTQGQREDLSDARLLLDNAAHNAQAALRNADPEEASEAFHSALALAQQALTALTRVGDGIKG